MQFIGKFEDNVKGVIRFKDNKDGTFDIIYFSVAGEEIAEWWIDVYTDIFISIYR